MEEMAVAAAASWGSEVRSPGRMWMFGFEVAREVSLGEEVGLRTRAKMVFVGVRESWRMYSS